MPTYSYRCTECDNAFDIHQAFTDDSLTECPVCGGRLRKVFGTVGVSFSGSGFYRNDSRAAERSGDAKKDSGPSDAGAGSPSKDTSSSAGTGTSKPLSSSDGGSKPAAAPAPSASKPSPATSTPSKS